MRTAQREVDHPFKPELTIEVRGGGHLITPDHAKEFLYTGDRISASQAVRIGRATRTFPDDALLSSALAMRDRLAALPRRTLETAKRAVNMHLRRAALDTLDFALAAEFHSFDTEDHQAKVAHLRSRIGREAD